MQTIHRVGIIGRGAIGALYGSLLQQSGVSELIFIADEQRRERYAREPFLINGQPARFTYRSEGAPLDLILIATKQSGLRSAIEQIRSFVDAHTLLLPCLNGITSETITRRSYARDQVIRCIVQGMDATCLGQELHYSRIGEILIGADHKEQQESIRSLKAFFDAMHIPCRVASDILREQWNKLMLNCGINQVCALHRSGYGGCQSGAPHQAEFIAAMKEVQAVANAQGIPLNDQDLRNWVQLVDQLDPQAMPSMAQDMVSGRKSELELFSGTVVPIARKLSIDVPVLTSLLEKITAMEQEL